MANTITTPFPTHHASLTDGSTTVNFIFSDSRGKVNPLAARRYPLQRTAIKTSQGSGKYSDLELPYLSIAQDDWEGGRGQEDFEDDTTRYYDAYRMATSHPNLLFPEGLETYTKGYRTGQDKFWMSDAGGWRYIYGETGPNAYMAVEFVASSTYAADWVEIYIAKHNLSNATDLTLELRTGSKAGAVLKTVTLTGASITDTTAELHRFDWTGTETLTSGNTYAFVLYTSQTGSVTVSNWQVLCGAGSGGYVSADDSTWSSDSNPFYFRVCAADTNTWFRFFEYKRQVYAISEPASGNSFLYINGDRGAADDNTADLTYLQDATKAWTVNEWAGCVALITKGPGSEEAQPWRVISSNTATALAVSPDWNVIHTTSTEYVILGSDKWTSLLDLGGYVTDVAVADEFVYFARGDSGSLNVLRYQAYNASGVWSTRNTADADKAVHLVAIQSTDARGTIFLWGTRNNHPSLGKQVWKGQVPRYWGDLYYEIATVTVGAQPFAEQAIANVTPVNNGWGTRFDVATGFATGDVASEAITATNITQGDKLAFESLSSVILNANDLTLKYSLTADLGGSPVTINLPAYTANTWQWTTVSFTMNASGGSPDYTEDSVISIGFAVAVDQPAFSFYVVDGIKLISTTLDAVKLPTEANITGITAYAGNANEPIVNPWIWTENAVYEIQTQNDNAVVELPLGEIAELRSEKNSQARTVNDVYLWFNLAGKLQRYYSRNLDDVGPDRDAGLPAARSGAPRALLSYPGKVYAAIDAGSSGTSSLLYFKSGWHEVYRAPRTGVRIYSMLNQSMPNDPLVSRLWVSQGADIIRIHQSLNPRQSSNYRYAPEAHIISSWIYAGMQDVNKYFKSITTFLSDGTNESAYIYVSYQLDDDTTWTYLGTISGLTDGELELGVNCKRIRFRYTIQTTISSTPYIKAWLLKGIGVVPIKHGYTWTTKLTELYLNADMYDLIGNAHGTLTTVDTVLAKLDEWASGATPLTLTAVYSALDGKTVILEDPGMQPVTYSSEPVETPVEEYVVNISCIDV